MEPLSVEGLNAMKLAELKGACKDRALNFSGTKPVLIGRILSFQQTGSAKESNKRSIDELKQIAEQNPSKKNRNKSQAMRELEKNKTKSGYLHSLSVSKKEFHALNELVLGTPRPHPVLDCNGACLDVEYDVLTLDQFIEQIKPTANTLKSANFSEHKYLCKELFERLKFPELEVVFADNRHEFGDEGLIALISACPSLKAINLRYSGVKGDGLENIHLKCPHLQYIELNVPTDPRKALSHLRLCKHLNTIVGLNSLDLDDECIEMLVATPKLQNCKIFAGKRLGGTESKITQKGLDLLKGKPFELIGLPTAAILAVASASTTDFAPKGEMTIDDFKAFISKAPNLKAVNLEECKIPDINEIVIALAQSPCASSLESLNLCFQSGLRDHGMKALGKFPSLKFLGLAFAWEGNMMGVRHISDEAFLEASKGWRELTNMEIQFAPVSAENMAQVITNCPKLAFIDMTGCAGESEDFVTMHYEMQQHPEFKRKGLTITHNRR